MKTTNSFTALALTASLFLSGVVAPVSPAHAASTRDEVRSCGVALDEKGMVEISNYRISLDRARGGGRRLLNLSLIPYTKADPKMKVACELRRGVVTDLRIIEKSVHIVAEKS